MTAPTAQVTMLLAAHAAGDATALGRVFELVYGELRRLARSQRRGNRALTLETTALVHEAYVKLQGGEAVAGAHRGQFFAVAAHAMRHILVDHARALLRDKRGGGLARVELADGVAAVASDAERVLAVNLALEKLEKLEPRLVKVVECRHFVGLSEEETAAAVGVSLRTVQRDWRAASLWLRRELSGAAAAAAAEPGSPR